MADYLRITYVRSAIDKPEIQQRTIRALGFRRLHQERIVVDSPSMRGMLVNVARLVLVAPASASDAEGGKKSGNAAS